MKAFFLIHWKTSKLYTRARLTSLQFHSTFLTIKLLDYVHGAHTHTHTLVGLSLHCASTAFLWLFHMLFIWSFAPSLPSFFVSAPSDLNCNNIVNWGYCKWRSQADRQPRFPALTAPHHSGKDTWFLNPHLALPHLGCLLSGSLRPGHCATLNCFPWFKLQTDDYDVA